MTKLDLACLNSATKYPSIPTHHTLDGRGGLLEEHIEFEGRVLLTEKINGVNARIILMPDGDWYIGSREELLTARGDRVAPKTDGVVDALRPLAATLHGQSSDKALVFFLEVFGGTTSAAKQYSSERNVGARLFDLAWVPMEVFGWERERIAFWREHGGQAWSTEYVLDRAAEVEGIELTPRLGMVEAGELPGTVEDTYVWLNELLPKTRVALDEGARGRAEGVVLRSDDRGTIAKARFEDYERTLKRREDAARAQTKRAESMAHRPASKPLSRG